MKSRNITLFFLLNLVLSTFTFASGRDYFASIAINPKTGIFGFGNGYKTESEAISVALQFCQKKNRTKSGCKTAVPFSNSCGAVAWSKSTHFWNGGWSDSNLEQAKRNAVSDCNRRGTRDCKIVEAFCTSWETNEYIWW